MGEEIFVIKDKFYKELVKRVQKECPKRHFVEFTWKGKKIYAKQELLYFCISRAEDEIRLTDDYRNKLTKRAVEIANQFTWAKNPKKYSRLGKWVRGK